MGAGIRLSPDAQEIVDSLRNTLGASVSLVDGQEHVRYFAMAGAWLCRPDADPQAPGAQRLDARINDRWTLSVSGSHALSADAESTTLWAARKLEAHLPARTTANPALFGISPARSGKRTTSYVRSGRRRPSTCSSR